VAGFSAVTTAVLVLGNGALIVWRPGLVDSGFLGWLDLPVAERLAVHLPLALAVLDASSGVLVVTGWVLHWWPSAIRLQYAALCLTAAVVAAQLAAWQLIGWGLS
jgi:hypothetical protein